MLSLILSDVVGDDLDVIGSGPTAPDASTFETAYDVLEKYELRERVPARVRERLRNGATETPKADDPLFENVENIIVGSNQKSLESAARAGEGDGLPDADSFQHHRRAKRRMSRVCTPPSRVRSGRRASRCALRPA